MSHAALLETIRLRDEQTALEMLREDPRLCLEADDPSALLHALYNNLGDVAHAIATRRPELTVFEAAALGHIAALRSALATHPKASTAFAADGFTALHLACFFGRTQAASHLLRAGADPHARAGNATLVCPLHSAATAGNAAICRMLLRAGADPNAAQQGGYTALQSAAFAGNAALVELLLTWGAEADKAGDDGRTAADFAASEGHAQLAARLARAGR